MPALAKKSIAKAPSKKTADKRQDKKAAVSPLARQLIRRAAAVRPVKDKASFLSLVTNPEK